jgi:hypothetical protein
MPTRKAKPEQVQASPPVRVDVRIGGRLRFSDNVYSPSFDIGENAISFTADLAPTMVDKPAPSRPATRFIDQTDPRDQEEIIQTVHSGRRDIIEDESEPEPKKAASKKPPPKEQSDE